MWGGGGGGELNMLQLKLKLMYKNFDLTLKINVFKFIQSWRVSGTLNGEHPLHPAGWGGGGGGSLDETPKEQKWSDNVLYM